MQPPDGLPLDSEQHTRTQNIGDLTASRKVRVFDIPVEEAYEMLKRKEKPPEHMANSLYLEWFSERNGRVVIESADYELTISAPEWRMTPEENEQRARDAANGLNDFMQKLTGSDSDGLVRGKNRLSHRDKNHSAQRCAQRLRWVGNQ